MHKELVALQVEIVQKEGLLPDILHHTFVAPSSVVKGFAEFLAEREETDLFVAKGISVPFQECSVTVGDSKQALSAFSCLQRYQIPMSNCDLCKAMLTSPDTTGWKNDPNWKMFSNWLETSV